MEGASSSLQLYDEGNSPWVVVVEYDQAISCTKKCTT
jgi:hypothetical protein